MARLNQEFNVLNLPNLNYEEANSRADTVDLVNKARDLHNGGLSIERIAEKLGKSTKRVKELITGVNQMPNSNVFKIISGID